MVNLNAIRAFSDKVRAMTAGKQDKITLSATEARNLNHEIEKLLLTLVELELENNTGEVKVEIGPNRF